MKKSLRNTLIVLFFDILIINLSVLVGSVIKHDFALSQTIANHASYIATYLPIRTVLFIAVFFLFRMYRFVWSLVSTKDVVQMFLGVTVASFLDVIVIGALRTNFKFSEIFIIYLLTLVFEVLLRLSYRIFKSVRASSTRKTNEYTPTLVIGAGSAGSMAVRELSESDKISTRVCCIVDDNPSKVGKYIEGVRVVGTTNDIPKFVEQYGVKSIVYAIPSSTAAEKKRILEICKTTKCSLKIMPGLYQMINGDLQVGKIRDVEIEDLLGRDPIVIDNRNVLNALTDKVVLVTGGGGSIGSELCRQIARNLPKKLIILDIYENNAYEIQQELVRNYPNLNFETVIASVRDEARIEHVFDTYNPQVVFHAAAHKHVPLMEKSPNEAVKNNVFGTLNVAKAADKFGAEKFILISTDKAVNPTNIMGATKRMCEMVVQTINKNSNTEFACVRFGNVLGSNGSVIPLFKEQIKKGGPVSVTHPDIIRYFMTIPEAVSLVLQAGAYAKGGEIFVLDMGQPVKIDDLARNLIRLSGYEPDVDIKIEYTGLRPGEKLYEELLMGEEGLQKTENKLIYIGHPIEFDVEQFAEGLVKLKRLCKRNSDKIKYEVAQIVGTYTVDKNEK
ncbi:MAG: polysaccharide biosynthesis protein [Clostridia bacterium]|nr:polysaccharide biosynthesis protein [Clostridia bacterium]